jgi:SEC-C motif-containing protein
MSTDAQIKANQANAAHSTGPTTDAGRAASSQNHLIHGLYTRRDFVKPEEQGVYKEFCDTLTAELGPFTFFEETHVSEIIAAAWRLRRCHEVEGDLAENAAAESGIDPLLDPKAEKTIRSLERARASAYSLLTRATNNLRKIQTERLTRYETKWDRPEETPLADSHKIIQALRLSQRIDSHTGKVEAEARAAAEKKKLQDLNTFLNAPVPPVDWARVRSDIEERKKETEKKAAEAVADALARVAAHNSGSNCKTDSPAAPEAPTPARTRLCPCNSGKKYKHCCANKAA